MIKAQLIYILLLLFAIPVLSDELSYIDSLENEYDELINTNKYEDTNDILYEMFIFYEERDVKKVIEICEHGINLADNSGDEETEYEWNMRLATLHRKLGNKSLAMENYQNAILIVQQGNINMPWFNVSIGNFYFSNLNYDKARKHYEKAIKKFKIYEKTNEKDYLTGTAVALNNIALCNVATNDTNNVLPYFFEAFELRKKLDDAYFLSHSALMIGKYYSKKFNIDSALFYFNLAIDYDKRVENKSFLINIFLEKAMLFCSQENYKKSLVQCKLAEERAISEGKVRFLPEIYFVFAKINLKNNKLSKSLHFAQKGKRIASENGDISHKLELLKILVSIHEKLGNIKKAYDNLWQYQKLSEKESISKIEQMQYSFEIEQSKIQIDMLNKNISQLENLSDMKLTIAIILIIAMLISVALLIVIIKKNNKVRSLLENEKRINERKAALADILKLSVDSDLKYEEFFQKTLDTILNIEWLPVEDRGTIFIRTINDEFILMAHKNLTENHYIHCQKIIPGECLCGNVIKTNKPQLGSHLRSKFEKEFDELPYRHIKLPINLGDEVYGVLNLLQKKDMEITDIDMALLESLCWSLAGIIKQHHLNEKLEKRQNDLDKLNQKLFANSLAVDQQNIEINKMNKKLNDQKIELEKAIATKNKFFNIIAHDLKNPFNSILGYSRLLVENIDRFGKEQIAGFVDEILDSSKATYKLLENLLQWARAQQDKIPFQPEETDLYTIVYENVLLLKPQAKSKNVEIIEDVAKDLFVYADVEMIKTVTRNLLSNAIKFTGQEGHINIHAYRDDGYVTVYVKDSGIGMSGKIKNSIFNIGEVKSKEGTEGETGTGFGLMISKEFIEKHNGKIWLESEEGKGSTFYFSLPNLTKSS